MFEVICQRAKLTDTFYNMIIAKDLLRPLCFSINNVTNAVSTINLTFWLRGVSIQEDLLLHIELPTADGRFIRPLMVSTTLDCINTV